MDEEDPTYRSAFEAMTSLSAPSAPDVRLNLLHAASGDPHLAAALRGMLWQEYTDAGQPLGPSEDALFRWAATQNNPMASTSRATW